MDSRKLFPAAFALVSMVSFSAPVLAYDPSEDIGGLLMMRGEITGIMDYCFKNVSQDQAYIEARDAWRVRNNDNIVMVDNALAKISVSDAEKQQVTEMIDKQAASDVDGQQDKAGFCTKLASEMKAGIRDLTQFPEATERLDRIRNWMQTGQ
jgi:hypothetical protein